MVSALTEELASKRAVLHTARRDLITPASLHKASSAGAFCSAISRLDDVDISIEERSAQYVSRVSLQLAFTACHNGFPQEDKRVLLDLCELRLYELRRYELVLPG